MSYLSVSRKYSSFNSELAKSEKNDCFVRALAVAADIDYNTAHSTAKEVFLRKEKTGTSGVLIWSIFDKATKAGMKIGQKKVDVRVLGKAELKNKYKVKGEIIWRKKTLKSFIESNPRGRFIVTVAGHALSVINGELQDWDSMKFKPTRKVLSAYEIKPELEQPRQLSLF